MRHIPVMTDLAGGIFAIIIWCAVPTVCAWFVIDGLRNGVVRVKLGSYSRADNPGWFWACITMYAALIAWFLYLSARMALGI